MAPLKLVPDVDDDDAGDDKDDGEDNNDKDYDIDEDDRQ